MLNNITLAGRLVKDPELRVTRNEVPVATFTVACEREYTPDKPTETDFIPCVAWQRQAEYIAKHFIKGELILLAGRLQLRDYTDKDGIARRVSEIRVDKVWKTEFKKKPQMVELDGEDGEFPF